MNRNKQYSSNKGTYKVAKLVTPTILKLNMQITNKPNNINSNYTTNNI